MRRGSEETGRRLMDFTGRLIKGYVFASEDGMKSKKAFHYWINLCLDFNGRAKASMKSKKKR
jgi:hypothetical protein